MSLVLALYFFFFIDDIVLCLRLFAFHKKDTKDTSFQNPEEDATEAMNLLRYQVPVDSVKYSKRIPQGVFLRY